MTLDRYGAEELPTSAADQDDALTLNDYYIEVLPNVVTKINPHRIIDIKGCTPDSNGHQHSPSRANNRLNFAAELGICIIDRSIQRQTKRYRFRSKREHYISATHQTANAPRNITLGREA